ncbi:TatD family hydrolase [Aureliella helgolandensis]|uniref:Putative deoxyribonuclease YcfH n=1 Tax=Aureliella helgolandensis TaxID=2527968 RepID=A0A518G5R3_9BACT|nr:TatD family hydrolase [Aureliella helgolandensis]QDV23936.1 putative deoxyribonuclease YcfH [Aureliella helgolandensis]
MIIDTHAHLNDPTLRSNIQEFLLLARQANVRGILSVGTTVESSQGCIELAEEFAEIRAAVGIHPNNCCQSAPEDWATIERMCLHPRVAALGETGLDRHWDDCPWEVQVDYFRRHLALSRETQLPVVIHTRECANETAALLEEEAKLGALRGVMHSFTGPVDVARRCLELGLYISFAGMVTFKNGEEIREIAKEIPADRILVETDCPYLTPHPFRGKRPNHPALVAHTLELVAEIRGVRLADFAAQTTANAQRLFGSW